MASALLLGVAVCFACASEPKKDEDGAAGDDSGQAASGGSSARGGSSSGGANAGAAGDGGGDTGEGGNAVGGSEATGGAGATGGSDASGGRSGSDSGGVGGGGGTTSGGTTSGGSSGSGGSNGGTMSGGASGSGGSSGGVSLVGNGDFTNGMEGWGVEVSAGGPVTIDGADGRLCVEATTNAAQIVVGWPTGPFSPMTLQPGVDYTFSFKAVSTRSLQVIGKLGLVSSPYTPYATQIVYVSGTWQTFTHSFVLNTGSDSIGVAISFALGALDAVCIDDVTVTSP